MAEAPAPLVFESGPAQSTGATLEEERDRHRRRAERFGTSYVALEKRKDLKLEFRKEKFKKEGFKTGLDLFDEEEMTRMRQRAERFQTELKLPEYKPAEELIASAEDEAKKQQRAARFGIEYVPNSNAGLMDIDVLEERKEIAWDISRRPEAIHLYGVDCMSTADCLSYFSDYGPTFVEWIDDSSCNVLFDDDFSAKRALVGRGRPLPPDTNTPDTAGLDPSDINNAPFLWHKGEDFQKGNTAIPLMYRMATVADVKPANGKKFSRYLWKMPVKQALKVQKRELNQKRKGFEEPDEDVQMRSASKSTRNERRKRLRMRTDVDMADAEALEEDEEQADHPEIEVEKPNVGDLRELLARRDEPTALFSAAAAGFIPLDDDDDDELGDADADEGDGAVNGEGDDAIVEGDGAAELGGDGGGC